MKQTFAERLSGRNESEWQLTRKRIRLVCFVLLLQFVFSALLADAKLYMLSSIAIFLLPWWIYEALTLPLFLKQVSVLAQIKRYRMDALPVYHARRFITFSASFALFVTHGVYFFFSSSMLAGI